MPLLNRTNLLKISAILLLFCSKSVFILHTFFTSPWICTFTTFESCQSPHVSFVLAAPCRAISARRIRGQVYHIHRVGSSLSFRIAFPSMVPLTALQLLEHRRRIARSSSRSLGNSETAGCVSFQCPGWPPEVELFTLISIELCCSCPQPQ